MGFRCCPNPGLERCSSAVSQDTFLNKQKEKNPQICSAGKAPNAFAKAASAYYRSAQGDEQRCQRAHGKPKAQAWLLGNSPGMVQGMQLQGLMLGDGEEVGGGNTGCEGGTPSLL